MFGPVVSRRLHIGHAPQPEEKNALGKTTELLKSNLSPSLSHEEKKFLQHKDKGERGATVEAAKKVIDSFDSVRADPLKRNWYEQALFILARDVLRSRSTPQHTAHTQEQGLKTHAFRNSIGERLHALLNHERKLLEQFRENRRGESAGAESLNGVMASINSALHLIQQLLAKAKRTHAAKEALGEEANGSEAPDENNGETQCIAGSADAGDPGQDQEENPEA